MPPRLLKQAEGLDNLRKQADMTKRKPNRDGSKTFRDMHHRFMAKVDVDGPVSPLTGSPCWIWLASTRAGYGQFFVASAGRPMPAHRVGYGLLKGDIPEGLELDHLCRVRSCVNPDHLEPVTHSQNIQRGIPYRRPRGSVGLPIQHPY